MVKVLIGDLFESSAQTLVNTVNCVGVMGKGIALEFKKRFPDMYEDYLQRCHANEIKLGRPYLFRRLLLPWILNFPTKDHWRSVTRLQDIIKGMEYLKRHYAEWAIASLAVPPLGCGEGQLEWSIVGPTLYRHLSELTIPVELYAPFGTPKSEIHPDFLEATPPVEAVVVDSSKPSRIKPGWVALVDILAHIQQEPYHWPIGRTSFQKIAYFATESGIPTGLQYRRGSYGPLARELKPLITRLVNNGLIREERLGRMFATKVGPTYEDARKVYQENLEQWLPIIDKITDLFMRMNTKQAELAATIHFAAKLLSQTKEKKPDEIEVLDEVKRWKRRRRPRFSDEELALTIRNLTALGWLDIKPSAELPLSS